MKQITATKQTAPTTPPTSAARLDPEEVLIELVLLSERSVPRRTSPICQRCSFEASRAVDGRLREAYSRIAGLAVAGTGRTALRRREAEAVEARGAARSSSCVARLTSFEALEALGVGVPVEPIRAGRACRASSAHSTVLDCADRAAASREEEPFIAEQA